MKTLTTQWPIKTHFPIGLSYQLRWGLVQLSIFLFLIFGFITSYGQESQNNILSDFQSGNYTVHKVTDKKKFEKVSKPWPVEITKQGSSVTNVLVKRAGILDEPFAPDVPGYPAYFGYKNYRLSFLNNYAVYYEWNGKEQATTKYVLVKNGSSFNLDYETTNQQVAEYAKATFKNQTNARAEVKDMKAEAAEEERLANSLQGKKVSKIEIKLLNSPSHVAHFSESIKYGVVATLVDGTILKTPNLGGKIPWEDFDLSNKGCSNTIDEVRVDEDASSLGGDEIVLHVSSKYFPSLKASKQIPTTNDVSVQVNQNGFWGHERHKHMTVFQGVDGQHAGPGDNLTIKVKTVTHKKTGAKINKIEVYNNTKNKTIARYKLTPSTELIINAKGGQGMDGWKGRKSDNKGGNGGNGADGGDVTIIKDPSVTKHNITINNQGGRGGNGGAPYYSTGIRGNSGRSGIAGNTKTISQSVELSF